MQYKGVEYSVIQMLEQRSWRWKINFGNGKTKSGETPISRASAEKIVRAEIDRFLKNKT